MPRKGVTKKINKSKAKAKSKVKRTRTMEETLKDAKVFKQQSDKLVAKKKLEEIALAKSNKNKEAAQAQLQTKKQDQKKQTKAAAKAQPQAQNQQQQQQQGDKKNLIRRASSSFAAKGKFREEDIPKYLNQEELREDLHELDEHHNFKERYLGREGMFGAYKVLVGCFYNFTYDGGFDQTAGEELKKRGFNYDLVITIEEFVKVLPRYDIAWVISNTGTVSNQEKYIEAIGNFMRAKKSLFLWVDNTPYTTYVDCLLKNFFDGMYMEGSYYGGQLIQKSEKVEKGKFDQTHSIAYGLNNLHEGITIAHPVKLHPDFKAFAHNSNDEAMVLYAEENENHGRIIIDTGFTKLFKSYWATAGTHQYVSNANVWLTGIPV